MVRSKMRILRLQLGRFRGLLKVVVSRVFCVESAADNAVSSSNKTPASEWSNLKGRRSDESVIEKNEREREKLV